MMLRAIGSKIYLPITAACMKRNGLDALNFQHKMNYNRNMNFKFSKNVSVPFLIYAVSSSTDLNNKCSIGELNLFLFFFMRWENIKI